MMHRITETIKQWVLALIRIKPVASASGQPVVVRGDYRERMKCRFGLLLVCTACVLCVVIGKYFKLQIIEHQQHEQNAKSVLGFKQKFLGTRGEIYDATDNLLVTNIRTRDLYITPRLVVGLEPKRQKEGQKKLYDLVEFLAPRIHLSEQELLKKCEELLEHGATMTVAENVSADVAGRIQGMKLNGVQLVPQPVSEQNDGAAVKKGSWQVLFTPMSVQEDADRDYVVRSLEDVLKMERGKLFSKVISVMRLQPPLLVARRMSLKEADKVTQEFEAWLKAYNKKKKYIYRISRTVLHTEESAQRFYPRGHLMPNLLGYCDTDGVGMSGIERLMDKELTASKVVRHIVLDGNIKRSNIPSAMYERSLNGYEVHLTIQMPIQQVVETAMAKLVEKHKPKRAYMVMLDPKTGAVMALAQYPNYNALDQAGAQKENREFHALVSGYEPGSIMKGVSVSSVMDYAPRLHPESKVYCENGRWLFAGKYLKEHGRAHFADLTLKEVIKHSSNIGSAKVVIDNMPEASFYKYLRAYGFGMPTYVGFFPQEKQFQHYFKGESRGMLKPVANWYKIDISRISIGHTILVTPLQMAQAYCAIANGGVMMQPYLIDRIVSPQGEVHSSVPYVKGRPISARSAQAITECLKTTVEPGGTGTKARVPGYAVAGKTGTAMKPIRNELGKWTYKGSRLNTASFIGFVPAEKPAFVLLVTADEPSGKDQYGGSVCGDSFSEIAQATLNILQVKPREELLAKNDKKKSSVAKNKKK